MREVSRSGCVGSLLAAVAICSLVGCVMPSRESLKEPAWPPSTGRGPTGGGGLQRTTLIKPFIPGDKPETVQQLTSEMPSGTQDRLPAAEPQNPAQQPGVQTDVAAQATVNPVPRPIRWHDPTQDQATYARPAVQTPSPQFPSAADPAREGLEQRSDAPAQSAPAAEAPPASLAPTPPASSASVQVPPQPVRPAPAVQASETMRPAPPAQSYAQLPPGQSHIDGREAQSSPRPSPVAAPAPAESAPRNAAVEAKSGSRQWEDQRVRQAAIKLAEQLQGVKKGKICYSVKNDEWWVVLYDDLGPVYDVKQFTWNRDQEKLEQFLVLKKIGKNRVEEDRSTRDPDRACESIDFK